MAASRTSDAPFLGVGVGLRPAHYGEVLARARERRLEVDWLEAISENYMVPGGRPLRILGDVRAARPLVLHGVSLNLGSADPIDRTYLDALAKLAERVEPAWISDHLCWTAIDGRHLHDLVPLPHTEACVHHVAGRIRRVQDRLRRRIAIENVSSYFTYAESDLTEWEFLDAVAREADCGILLDVNNVFVSAHNHGFDPRAYIDAVDASRVFQIHLAGHGEDGPLLVDTHDRPVPDAVWALYAHALARTGPVSTLVEWDGNLPPLDRLCEEVAHARRILAHAPWSETHHERPRLDPAPALATADCA